MDIQPEERSKRAEQFFKDLIASDPSLSENPLYQHISKQLTPSEPEPEVVPGIENETKEDVEGEEMFVENKQEPEVAVESTDA